MCQENLAATFHHNPNLKGTVQNSMHFNKEKSKVQKAWLHPVNHSQPISEPAGGWQQRAAIIRWAGLNVLEIEIPFARKHSIKQLLDGKIQTIKGSNPRVKASLKVFPSLSPKMPQKLASDSFVPKNGK